MSDIVAGTRNCIFVETGGLYCLDAIGHAHKDVHMTANALTSEALLDIDDVGKLLHCSAATIRRLVATQRIPAPARVGKLLRWRRSVIERWLDAGGSAAAPAGTSGESAV